MPNTLTIKFMRQYGQTVGAEATDEKGTLVASARVVGYEPGLVVVEERHFSPLGNAIYSGRLLFGNGEILIKEEAITGTKERQVFRSWSS